MIIRETEDVEVPEASEVEQEEEKRARKGLKKGKILENLKNHLSDIFDESDVKM